MTRWKTDAGSSSVRSVAVADWLIMVRPASSNVPLVARVSPENAPPITPRNASSVAILVAAGVALAGSPSVSNSVSVMSQSALSSDHCFRASFAPLTDGMTTLALLPLRAPMTPIVPTHSSPSALVLSSVVPQADTARPSVRATAPSPNRVFRLKTFYLSSGPRPTTGDAELPERAAFRRGPLPPVRKRTPADARA